MTQRGAMHRKKNITVKKKKIATLSYLLRSFISKKPLTFLVFHVWPEP